MSATHARSRTIQPPGLLALVVAGLLWSAPALGEAPPADAPPSSEGAPEGTPEPAREGASDEGTPESAALDATLENQSLQAPEVVTVGQPFELVLTVKHPAGTRVVPGALPESTRWELLDRSLSEAPGEGAHTTTVALKFAIFRPGPSRLPELTLEVGGPDGRRATLRTEAVTISVHSVLDGEEEPTLRAARPPVPIWVEDHRLLWAAGGGLVALLLALVALVVLRRRRADVPDAAPVVRRPADEVALEKLQALARSSYLETGEYMLFYVRLSEAVREYLGRRYGFPGLELTNAEIRERLRAVQWPSGLELQDIVQWLDHCDFVKFSGTEPTVERGRDHLKRAFTIVELTKRRAPVAEVEAESVPASDGAPPALRATSPSLRSAPSGEERPPAPDDASASSGEEEVP